MNNGFLHEQMVDRIESFAVSAGARSIREFPVRLPGQIAYIDLLIEMGGLRISNEVEIRSFRIKRNVPKAIAVQASLLQIITTTGASARRARQFFRAEIDQYAKRGLTICFLPLPAALQQLANLFSQKTKPFPETINNPTNHEQL